MNLRHGDSVRVRLADRPDGRPLTGHIDGAPEYGWALIVGMRGYVGAVSVPLASIDRAGGAVLDGRLQIS